jgi:hypothetical protein
VSQQRETAGVLTEGLYIQPDLRASDADREAVARMLGSAFAEGRLTAAEHAERVTAAYEARSSGALNALTVDLPDPAGTGKPQPAFVPAGVDRCLLCVLLICCPPVGIAWLLAARRRALRGAGANAADR